MYGWSAELIGNNHPPWLYFAKKIGVSLSDAKNYGNSPVRLGKRIAVRGEIGLSGHSKARLCKKRLKFTARGGLLFADAPSGDFGPVVILAFDGAACHAPQHGDLANVGERIGDWTLE